MLSIRLRQSTQRRQFSLRRSLVIPSWKTGVLRRLNAIPFNKIFEFAIAMLFFAILILLLVSPIVFALYTPPMMEIGG